MQSGSIITSFPLRILGWIAMAVVFLNLTNLYTLISGLTGLPFRFVGIAFIGILGLYVVSSIRDLKRVLSCKPFVAFLVLFTLIPAVSVFIAPITMLRFSGYNVLSALIFLTSVIWLMQNGWERFCKIILISWAVGVFFIVLSYFLPGFFAPIAEMQAIANQQDSVWGQIRIAQEGQGRAFGLYMQSNRASLALALHLLILLPTFFHNRPIGRMVILGVTFFAVLLTGSRGGFIYVIAVTGLLFVFEMLRGVRQGGHVVSGLSLLPRYFALGILAIGLFTLAALYGGQTRAEQSPVDRIMNSFFDDSVDLTADASVQARLYAQQVYIQKIAGRPVIGHGLGASDYERYMGTMPLSSHNMILETAYAYGIPVMLACYGLLFFLAKSPQSRKMRSYFRYDLSSMLVIFFVMASFASTSVFDYRIFPVVMAFWMTMLYFPVSSYQQRLV